MPWSRTQPGSEELAELTRRARTAVTFVQLAGGARADAHGLTLTDLSPSTIWILHDTPQRVGHLATGTFLDLWWDSRSGLSSSWLRGVLGQADPDAQLLGAPVLRVASPRISGSGVHYEIELLAGVLPRDIGACILFLGPGDRPDEAPPADPPLL
jgi:hypothetical protein